MISGQIGKCKIILTNVHFAIGGLVRGVRLCAKVTAADFVMVHFLHLI